jgi:hypothetical protein
VDFAADRAARRQPQSKTQEIKSQIQAEEDEHIEEGGLPPLPVTEKTSYDDEGIISSLPSSRVANKEEKRVSKRAHSTEAPDANDVEQRQANANKQKPKSHKKNTSIARVKGRQEEKKERQEGSHVAPLL